MSANELTGKVQTVLGPVSPAELGITLPHEHLMIDFRTAYKRPKYASDCYKGTLPVSLSNLEWVRHNRLSSLDNLLLGNEEEAITEAMLFKNEGGGSIVDVSNKSFARDPKALARISRATGLNVIMGSGYFISKGSNDLAGTSEVDIINELIKEIEEGVDNTDIKVGIIGELGCSWPLSQEEKKMLTAASKVQQRTGIPISIHPGQHPDSPFEILEVLTSAGAKAEHVIIGHLERTLLTLESMEKLAKTGCFMEFDAFGKEGYFSGAAKTDLSIDIPNDHYRINIIINLMQKGYGDQILMSQDICTKDMMATYGGYGYAHILKRVVPIMCLKGIKEKDIMKLIEGNPQRALTFFEF